ncbi:MAG: sulfotransferase, partial [Proteobacteria bacterium]|nr:sulfotransferase [Pseudomonadota bacterium]
MTLAELERSAQGQKRSSRAHAELSHALWASAQREEALKALEAAAALPPGEVADLEALGFVAFGQGRHQLSMRFYRQAAEARPDDPTCLYNLATALRNVGDLEAAETWCDRCLALAPQYAQAALLRSGLRTQTAQRHHVSEMRAALSGASTAAGDQIFFHYALGKELDDLGDFDAAFSHFSAGAALRRRMLQYDLNQDLAKFDRIRSCYSAGLLSASPLERPGPYGFILGLPRSGTTLVERILTGSPDVDTNGETDNVMEALLRHQGAEGEDIFHRAAQADHAAMGATYARLAGTPPPGGRRLEKLPLNYLYLGAIRLSLPSARIISVRRSPADNCFAMFSTLFGSAYPYSYDLAELAHYYRAYADLMDHWRDVAGDVLLEIPYDGLTADPARHGASMARHLDIAWSDDMTRVEDNRRASATASAAQVRRPIFRTSVGRWRNYERHLAPLI